MQRFLEAIPRTRALVLLAAAVTGCSSLSTKIQEHDESKKAVRLSPGQEVVVLMPRAQDVEALSSALEGSSFNSVNYLQFLHRALLQELDSLGALTVAELDRKSDHNTLEVVVLELSRRRKVQATEKDEATLRARNTLVVDGEKREFDSVTRQVATTTLDAAGMSLALIDPAYEVIRTSARAIAAAVVGPS